MNPTDGVVAIVPAHNEAPRVGPVVAGLVAQGLTVLVVDDGSADTTAEVAAAAGAQVLSLRPNRGKGAALKAGFTEVLGGGYRPAEGAWRGILVWTETDSTIRPRCRGSSRSGGGATPIW